MGDMGAVLSRLGMGLAFTAAAAAVGILPSAGFAAARTVVFNRPYLMLVTGTSTGEPLFLAKVANPAAG